MILELDIGAKQVVTGSTNIRGRGDRTGALVVQMAHATYQEAVLSGRVHIASGVVAGVAPGTALSTTPPFAIWNPPSSGVNVVLWKIGLGYVSGTLGSGTVYICQGIQATLPTGGAELTPVNALFGMPKTCQARVWAGSTVVQATIVRPSLITSAFLATTALLPQLLVDPVDGEVVAGPGTTIVYQSITGAAGSTPLTVMWAAFEEVPLL